MATLHAIFSVTANNKNYGLFRDPHTKQLEVHSENGTTIDLNLVPGRIPSPDELRSLILQTLQNVRIKVYPKSDRRGFATA